VQYDRVVAVKNLQIRKGAPILCRLQWAAPLAAEPQRAQQQSAGVHLFALAYDPESYAATVGLQATHRDASCQRLSSRAAALFYSGGRQVGRTAEHIGEGHGMHVAE